jgi:dUTP pyrophosphatase
MNIKLIRENAKIPTQGSALAAGYDLYAAPDKIIFPDNSEGYESIEIPPHSTAKVPTGIILELPDSLWGGVYARSGLATKQGLRPANCCGVIDPDYRGEIFVAIHNDTDEYRYIENGERIAQLIFHERIYLLPDDNGDIFTIVDDVTNTDRGDGGFGSTGSN